MAPGGEVTVQFRGHPFRVVRGKLHPEFSVHLMDEEHDLREKYWNVGPGEVVVDVGASYGSYTLPACAMGAFVYAFEPEKWVYEDLVANLKLNGWWQTRCTAFNDGLWNASAEVRMETYAPHWPAGTISGVYRMIRLDDVVRALGMERVDWIKIDVEGAERQVLEGAVETLRRFRPKLLVECHVFLDADLKAAVEAVLREAHPDYRIEEIPRPPCVMLYVS